MCFSNFGDPVINYIITVFFFLFVISLKDTIPIKSVIMLSLRYLHFVKEFSNWVIPFRFDLFDLTNLWTSPYRFTYKTNLVPDQRELCPTNVMKLVHSSNKWVRLFSDPHPLLTYHFQELSCPGKGEDEVLRVVNAYWRGETVT